MHGGETNVIPLTVVVNTVSGTGLTRQMPLTTTL